jgi:hypothetical protein
VDIISMSFALTYPTDELEKAVRAAAYAGIVMVASTADDGENKPEVWPASYPGVLGVAACDEHGVRTHYSSPDTQFYFQGERIVYESLQGSETREEISGSSVSTAIAAGVAALYLSCCQLQGVEVAREKRATAVETIFHEMKGRDKKEKTKYVRPWIVFGEGGRRSGSDTLMLPEHLREG